MIVRVLDEGQCTVAEADLVASDFVPPGPDSDLGAMKAMPSDEGLIPG
jgi:hypothetical protein